MERCVRRFMSEKDGQGAPEVSHLERYRSHSSGGHGRRSWELPGHPGVAAQAKLYSHGNAVDVMWYCDARTESIWIRAPGSNEYVSKSRVTWPASTATTGNRAV